MRFLASIVLWAAAVGCAALHRTQLADVEPAGKGHHVSVKVSETTLDFAEMARLAKLAGSLMKSGVASRAGEGLDAYTTYFQFGPRTGTPVFNEAYARFVPELLREKCPKGRLVNILSTRETREYPVVKGEIVRIDADCLR
jgi:hypothetical protein